MADVLLIRPSVRSTMLYPNLAASTALTANTIITHDEDASGQTILAATATTERIYGVLQQTIASTDSNYASAKRVPVLFDPDGIWELTIGTGTADANDEQGYIDLKDTDEGDVTASAIDMFLVTKFISGTKVHGFFVRWATHENPASN